MQKRRYSAGGRAGRRPASHNRSFGGSRSNNQRRGRRASTIDPNRFIKAAKSVEAEEYMPHYSFEDFKIDESLKQNLKSRGYVQPTQVQDQAIPLALDGVDVVGIANTGTGKTAAFLLPVLTSLLSNRGERALILAPTRELALQIQQESRIFAAGTNVRDTLLIGGVSMHRQLSELKRRPAIVIGTPGRVKDHIERGTLKLDRASKVVLDEVDRMLDMGFVNDIREILKQLPEKRQSLYFSATISPEIQTLIRTFTHNPKTIMARTAETSENVEQTVEYYADKAEKLDKLHDLLISNDVEKTLVFTETKHGADRLTKSLVERGFKADAIHGNKSQNKRQRALGKFRNSEIEVLVATDVAARGIDVDGISHIVNFEIPQTYSDYTHRIGRVGRAGNRGHAVTLVEK